MNRRKKVEEEKKSMVFIYKIIFHVLIFLLKGRIYRIISDKNESIVHTKGNHEGIEFIYFIYLINSPEWCLKSVAQNSH